MLSAALSEPLMDTPAGDPSTSRINNALTPGTSRIEQKERTHEPLVSLPACARGGAARIVLRRAPSVVFWQVFWQTAPGAAPGKSFCLVCAAGIEPATSAVLR